MDPKPMHPTSLLAFTRPVSPRIRECERTFLESRPIDAERAAEQFEAYERALEELGCSVQRLEAAPDFPDSVFVEDTASVFDEVAVIARPGAESRRREVASVAPALSSYRPLRYIEPPGTLDGGDVLRLGRTVYVGASRRTDEGGREQLAEILSPHGYEVVTVPVRGCLHLKTAATEVGDGALLVNPEWVDPDAFEAERLEVDPEEPFAANALRVGDTVLHPVGFGRTRARLEAHGIRVRPVELSELGKAEGGVTCCSLLFPADPISPHAHPRVPGERAVGYGSPRSAS